MTVAGVIYAAAAHISDLILSVREGWRKVDLVLGDHDTVQGVGKCTLCQGTMTVQGGRRRGWCQRTESRVKEGGYGAR